MDYKKLILFGLINFAGLMIGGLFTGKGVPSAWYVSLAKAPWTPPGWVFGAAWTSIMVCFSIFMVYWWGAENERTGLLTLFTLAWLLNVIWNPLFFHYHMTTAALMVIVLLALCILWILFTTLSGLHWKTLLLVPYILWLFIAISLNAYIVLKN